MFLWGTLFILNVVGTSPLSTGIFAKVRLVLFCCNMVLFSGGIIAGGIYSFEGLPTWVRWSDVVPGLIQGIWKVGVLVNSKKELAEALRSVRNFWKTDILTDDLKSEVDYIHQSVSRALKAYYIFAFLVYIEIYLTPYIQGSPQLPVIFILDGIEPYHNYMFIFQLSIGFFFCIATVAFEGLFIYYVAKMIIDYKIIRYIFDGKITCPISFVENAKHHSFLIRFVKKISDIYQYTFMNMILTTFCYICFGLFLMTQKGMPPSLDDITKYGGLIGVTSLQIAMYCFIGQLLVDESLKIADVFFYKDWPLMKPYQNAFGRMMVMRMSQKGQRLSVGGYFALDLGAYSWMMKNVVSFFTFMRALSREM